MKDELLRQKLDELASAVIFLARQKGHRLTRSELCERLKIHRNTLSKRLDDPDFPRPDVNGRWLFCEVLEWEMRR